MPMEKPMGKCGAKRLAGGVDCSRIADASRTPHPAMARDALPRPALLVLPDPLD
jgi:hypothetical protein